MAIAFEENENEAAICRRQIEELKQLIAAKDLQLKDHQIKIKNLEDQMNRNDDDLRKTESTPAEEDESEKMNDSQQVVKVLICFSYHYDSLFCNH